MINETGIDILIEANDTIRFDKSTLIVNDKDTFEISNVAAIQGPVTAPFVLVRDRIWEKRNNPYIGEYDHLVKVCDTYSIECVRSNQIDGLEVNELGKFMPRETPDYYREKIREYTELINECLEEMEKLEEQEDYFRRLNSL